MVGQQFSFHIEVEDPGPVCVVAVAGMLEPAESETLQEELNRLYVAGARRFVFDLSELDYVGSMGLRVFTWLAGKVRPEGKVCLCRLTPEVRQIFEVTKLTRLFTFYATRELALDAARTT